MQKNVSKAYSPDWVRTVSIWAEASKREVRYALCDDRRTLLWLANQRAIEYHPTLGLATNIYDPHTWCSTSTRPLTPTSRPWSPSRTWSAVRWSTPAWQARSRPAAPKGFMYSCRSTMTPQSRTSPPRPARSPPAPKRSTPTSRPRRSSWKTVAARSSIDSTRAGGATVAAVYSPRLRPGTTVSFPVEWSDLDRITPGDFTVHTAVDALDGGDPWAKSMPAPQRLPGRPDRRSPANHSRSPRRRHARGQTPRPCPPGRQR